MAIPNYESIGDATAAINTKSFCDAGSHLALQAAQNYGAHANRINVMSESVLGALTNQLVTPDPVEAISTVKMMTSRESMGIAEAIALAQQLVKGAQTTPPPTS